MDRIEFIGQAIEAVIPPTFSVARALTQRTKIDAPSPRFPDNQTRAHEMPREKRFDHMVARFFVISTRCGGLFFGFRKQILNRRLGLIRQDRLQCHAAQKQTPSTLLIIGMKKHLLDRRHRYFKCPKNGRCVQSQTGTAFQERNERRRKGFFELRLIRHLEAFGRVREQLQCLVRTMSRRQLAHRD